jgi:hypothetical protein
MARPKTPGQRAALSRTQARFDRQAAVKQSDMPRDFPDVDNTGHRKAVCKRCHCVMSDCESMTQNGEYHHPTTNKEGKPHTCVNSGLTFSQRDLEIEPFIRKSVRVRHKRNKVRP